MRAPVASVAGADLAEETPIAMVFDGSALAVMMATPQDLEDFALGFALSEQVISDPSQIERFEIAEHEQGLEARFWLRPREREALSSRRRYLAGPVGCGLCGIDSLSEASRDLPVVPPGALRLTAAQISGASDLLRSQQPLHDATRAVHAAGLLLPGQGVICVREDIGRHNALDKLIGAIARNGIDPKRGAVVMTSRLSTELVQKAAVAGIPALISVSSPTAEAVRRAADCGIALVSCRRGASPQVYGAKERFLEDLSHDR